MDLAKRLTAIIQEYSIPLIVGVVAGLAAANIDIHFYERLVDYPVFGPDVALFGRHITVHFLINEVFMVFFFGVATKEITEALLPGGVLSPLRRAINPLMGTLGGVLGPAAVYLLLTLAFFGGSSDFGAVARGWAIPTATDIALAWLVARLVFGPLHPAVSFLLLLAVADDAIGLGIIAVFYPNPELPVQPAWLLLTVAGMAASFQLRRLRVNNWLPYIVIGGVMSWIGLAKAAIEPALALVVIVPFLPGAQNYVGPNATPVPGAGPAETGAEGQAALQRQADTLAVLGRQRLCRFGRGRAGHEDGDGRPCPEARHNQAKVHNHGPNGRRKSPATQAGHESGEWSGGMKAPTE